MALYKLDTIIKLIIVIIKEKVIYERYNLILIDFAVLQLSFSLLLKRDDNQGHEDVDKEEWKDDEVNYVENGHLDAKVSDGALVFMRGRHRVL